MNGVMVETENKSLLVSFGLKVKFDTIALPFEICIATKDPTRFTLYNADSRRLEIASIMEDISGEAMLTPSHQKF
jgi:hypothetical protein